MSNEEYDSSFKSLIDKKQVEWNSLKYKSIISKWVNISLNYANHLEQALMSNEKDMIVHLRAWLIKKKLNEILLNTSPLYKNKSLLS